MAARFPTLLRFDEYIRVQQTAALRPPLVKSWMQLMNFRVSDIKIRPLGTNTTKMSDANGVEALEGETEAEYVARQTRLREEAAERMRQKFGSSGGLNGRLGGVGSQSCGSSGFGSSGGSSGGGVLGGVYDALPSASAVGGTALAGVGTAASVLASTSSWVFGKAAQAASGAAQVVGSARQSSFQAQEDPYHIEQSSSPHSSFENSNDISDLLRGGRDDEVWARGPAAERDVNRNDLSDLLSSTSLGPSDTPPRRKSSFGSDPLPSAAVGDAFFGADNWDSQPSTPMVSSIRPAVTSSSVVSRSRKVAAKKDNSWDDNWGDAW
jgi:hypothetical protein